MDVSWLRKDGDGVKTLCETIRDIKNPEIKSTEFINTLVQMCWEKNRGVILISILVPNLTYAASTITYMTMNLDQEKERESQFEPWLFIPFLISSLLWVLLVYEEFEHKLQSRTYFTSVYNVFDVFQFSATFFILVSDYFKLDIMTPEALSLIATYDIILLWIKVAEVFRVIKAVSFYVQLIFETIKDIGAFLMVFLGILCAFTTATYMHDTTTI